MSLHSVLFSNFRNRTLSGAFSNSYAQIYAASGRHPAILGIDIESASAAADAISHWNRGGIPALFWNWSPPQGFNLGRAVDSSTADYAAVLAAVDGIAVTLSKLFEKKVAGLFRPFRAGAGVAEGPGVANELYRIVFSRLFTKHHLNNLIWVWESDAGVEAGKWFPGTDVVDIVGVSVGGDGHLARKEEFAFGREVARGLRMVGITECKAAPSVEAMKESGAVWSFFVVNDDGNSDEFWRKEMERPEIVSLEGMPGWA
jgi:mannan endo-1,4-beta-mannosidase